MIRRHHPHYALTPHRQQVAIHLPCPIAIASATATGQLVARQLDSSASNPIGIFMRDGIQASGTSRRSPVVTARLGRCDRSGSCCVTMSRDGQHVCRRHTAREPPPDFRDLDPTCPCRTLRSIPAVQAETSVHASSRDQVTGSWVAGSLRVIGARVSVGPRRSRPLYSF